MSEVTLGVVAVALAGLANGSFAVPSHWIRKWSWQQIWLVYIASSCLVLPVSLALVISPTVFIILANQPLATAKVVLLGLGWGLGVLFFGLSLDRVGISITNAVVSGVAIIVGSAVPLAVEGIHLSSDRLLALISGLLLTLIGIIGCCRASILRDRLRGALDPTGRQSSALGMIFALFAGVLGAFLNLAFVAAGPLTAAGKVVGMGEVAQSLTAWIPILFGGFLTSGLNSCYQLQRTGSWSSFKRPDTGAWTLSVLMGVLWFVAIALYGAGALMMGPTGPVYGWAICVGTSILVSTLWGVVIGEWRAAPLRVTSFLYSGVLLVLAALLIMARYGTPE